MAKKIGQPCKICNHNLRIELELMHLSGKYSLRDLEAWLKKHEPFNAASFPTIQKHMSGCIDDKYKVKLKYLEEKKKIAEGEEIDETDLVNMQLKELIHIDDTIKECILLVKASAHEIKQQINNKRTTYDNIKDKSGRITGVKELLEAKVAPSMVTTFQAACSELRQQILTKQKILGDDKNKAQEAVESLVDIIINEDQNAV